MQNADMQNTPYAERMESTDIQDTDMQNTEAQDTNMQDADTQFTKMRDTMKRHKWLTTAGKAQAHMDSRKPADTPQNFVHATDIIHIVKKNFIFYLTSLLIIFGMKYFYSQAGSDDLRWILAPTARWVEILSGIPFVYRQGMGYVNQDLLLLIAPSCSGIQFMIITMALLIFSFTHRAGKWKGSPKAWGKPCWVAASVLLSYLLTVFINGLRIIVAIYLPRLLDGTRLYGGFLTPERLHTLIGTVVYFISLLTIYQSVSRLLKGGEEQRPGSALIQLIRRCAPPAFWYFAIVLGVPFLNRAYQKNSGKFYEFASLITLCCGIVLLLYCLVFLLRRALRRQKTHGTRQT